MPNFPLDAVLGQVALGADGSINWFDDTWYTFVGTLVTGGNFPVDAIQGQIVIGSNHSLNWYVDGSWYTAPGFVVGGNPPIDAITGQLALGNDGILCWHQDGVWYGLAQTAAIEKIYFGGYTTPDTIEASVQACNADGSPITTTGNKITRYTVSQYSSNVKARSFDFIAVSRDYTKLYAARSPGVPSGPSVSGWTRDVFMQISGGKDGPYIHWSLTNNPDTDIWVDIDFGTDSSSSSTLSWCLHGNTGLSYTQRICTITHNTGNIIELCLFRDTLSDFDPPDGWLLRKSGPGGSGEICRIYGHVSESGWHNIKVHAPKAGSNVELVLDGVTVGSSTGSLGSKVTDIKLGFLGPSEGDGFNYDGGGWYYVGKFKVGTASGADDVLSHAWWQDGFVWQNPQNTTYSYAHYPNMELSPDETIHRNYTINVVNGDVTNRRMTDYLFNSHPTGTLAVIFSDPDSIPAHEVWEMDQTGSIDPSISDTLDTSKRLFRQSSGLTYPSFQGGMTFGITGNGLEILMQYFEATESYPASSVFNQNPTSLYRMTNSGNVLLKSGYDYPIVNGGSRYGRYDAGFTPSGNKIWWIKPNLDAPGWEIVNRDGTGYQLIPFGSYPNHNMNVMLFNPADENYFYYVGENSSGTAYRGLHRINISTGVHTFILDIASSVPNYPIMITPAFSPDKTKMAFRGQTTAFPNIYIINADGSGLENLTDAYTIANAEGVGNRISWSRDGTEIAYLTGSLGTRLLIKSINILTRDVRTIIAQTDDIETHYGQSLTWFHGWQGEYQT